MPEGGWLAEEKVRFYVGMNDGNCISPFRADKWTRCSGKWLQRLLFVQRLGRIAALLLMLRGEDAVVAE